MRKRVLSFTGVVLGGLAIQLSALYFLHSGTSSEHYSRLTTNLAHDFMGGGGATMGTPGAPAAGAAAGASTAAASRGSEVGDRRARRHAYVFLMAGCDPANPAYLGYVYNILVSAHVLQTSNSTADVVALVRMATGIDARTIPEQSILESSGVTVRYIAPVKSDSFYTAMLDKFRVLQMTEYDRILFLDSDVVPFCSLDYMFEGSYGPNALLKPNVILSFAVQPAQGGFFMLQPLPGDYERIQHIIRERMRHSKDFDIVWGWGHEIKEPDFWYNFHGQGMNWTFYGAFADQGLLYHWVKYVKKNFTIIHRNKVATWSEVDPMTHRIPIPVGDSAIALVNDTAGQLTGCKHGFNMNRGFHLKFPPYEDFHHFTGRSKPWLKKNRPEKVADKLSDVSSQEEFWFYHLTAVKEKLDLEFDVMDLDVGSPSLGLVPAINQIYQHHEAQHK